MKKTPLLAFALLLLLTAVGLVAYGEIQIASARFKAKLHDTLPAAPFGWSMKEKPIADSEEMQKAVDELLNFDDGVFVDYTNGANDRLSVYIAYWSPGKMSHRLVAGHTPDICWVGGGWVKTKSGNTQPMPISQPGGTRNTPIGESRTFTLNGTTEYVWFWHMVGSKSKSYATGAGPPWYASITDLFSEGLTQRDEQFFIRISSNKPLESFIDGPVLPMIIDHLPWPDPR